MMSKVGGSPNKLWFIRRDGLVKGPFPTAQVSRYVLLGRLRGADELSPDQVSWRPLSELSELIPRATTSGADEEALARLKGREDERSGLDRRAGAGPVPAGIAERRARRDRRTPEAPEVVARRARRMHLLRASLGRLESYRLRWVGTGVVLLVILGLGLWHAPPPVQDVPRCDAPPAPGVNWDNCRLEDLTVRLADLSGARVRNAKLRQANLLGAKLIGADLAYTDLVKANLSYADLSDASLKGTNLLGADLAYANLRNADLSFADLSTAVLGGAELSGAQLDNAVWIDGRICQRGSIGRCVLASPGEAQ